VTYPLIVTATAEQHILETCFYYEEQQAGLAERFLSELYKAYEKISTHPEYYSFISAKDNFRDVRLHTFPYVVIYEIKNNEVIVIAVFNTHKKPLF